MVTNKRVDPGPWAWSEPDWRGACYCWIKYGSTAKAQKYARIVVGRRYAIVGPSGEVIDVYGTIAETDSWIKTRLRKPKEEAA